MTVTPAALRRHAPVAFAALLLGLGCSDSLAPDTTVNRITLTPLTSTVSVGATQQLIATARNRRGDPIAGVPFDFTSDQPSIATVNANGLVTGVGTGVATLHATSGDFSASVVITVEYATCANSGVTATITTTQTINGTLAATDCAIVPVSNADGYRFVATTTTTVLFTLTGANIAPKLSLTGSTLGTVVTENWSDVVGDTVRLIATVTAGTYHLWVLSDFTQLGAYTLTSKPATQCTTASAATTIALDQTVANALTSTSCLLPNAAEGAGYTFTLTEATDLRFDAKTVGFEPWIVVTNASFQVLSVSNAFGADSASLKDSFDPGIYYVWVTSEKGGQGTFTLKRGAALFTYCDVPVDTMTIPGSINGALTQDDCILDPGFYSDPIFLDVPAPMTLRVDLVSTAFDPYLGIADSTDTIVLTDDDSGGNFNSRIQVTFPKGRYVLLPMAFDRNAIGSYSISVSVVAGVMGPNIVMMPKTRHRTRSWSDFTAAPPHE